MTAATIAAFVLGALIGLLAGYLLPPHGRRILRERGRPVGRILLPLTGQDISRAAFEAALRLARAEHATLMPALLFAVPRTLPLDSPLPAQSRTSMPLLEVIEQRAEAQGVSVDSRVAQGRTFRDALRRLLQEESFDRIVVSAGEGLGERLSARDLEWLLQRVPGEVLILRPARDDRGRIAAPHWQRMLAGGQPAADPPTPAARSAGPTPSSASPGSWGRSR